MAKFAANNNKLTSAKLYLFFAIKAFYFCMSFKIVELFDANTYKSNF